VTERGGEKGEGKRKQRKKSGGESARRKFWKKKETLENKQLN